MAWRRKADGRPYVDVFVNGKRRRFSMLSDAEIRAHAYPDDAECESRYQDFLRRVLPGLERGLPEDGTNIHTLAGLLDWYRDVYCASLSEGTKASISYIKKMLLSYQKEKHKTLFTSNLSTAELLDISSWFINQRHGSASTIKMRLQRLNAALRAAVEAGLIPSVPCKFPRLRAPQRTIRALTPEQLQTVLQDVRIYRPDYYPVILFLAATGLRGSDVCSLQHDSIDVPRRRITISMGKTKRLHAMHLSDQAIEAIRLAGTSSGHVFRVHGRPISLVVLRIMLYRLEERCQWPFRCSPHVFRHTLATIMASRAVPPRVIQSVLGHANVRTTIQFYQGYFPGQESQYLDDYAQLLDVTATCHPPVTPRG